LLFSWCLLPRREKFVCFGRRFAHQDNSSIFGGFIKGKIGARFLLFLEIFNKNTFSKALNSGIV